MYKSVLHKPRILPIIHNIPSITLYTSIQHLFKNQHLTIFTSFLRQTHNHRTLFWGQSEKSMAAWIHHIHTETIQDPGRPLFITKHQPPTLEASTRPTKTSCLSKIAHSSIPSYQTFFITLSCGIWLFYIVTNSNQYRRD